MADDLWASFRQAGFTCWSPAALTVRAMPAGDTSGPFPFPGAATFVTADNPGGIPADLAQNIEGRAALAAHLDRRGLAWHPAIGGEPHARHHEPGAIVLGLDLRSAADLGARFDQAAVYLWTAEALHLVACAGGRHDVLGYRATVGSRLRPPQLRATASDGGVSPGWPTTP